jgi:hypothetical protein
MLLYIRRLMYVSSPVAAVLRACRAVLRADRLRESCMVASTGRSNLTWSLVSSFSRGTSTPSKLEAACKCVTQ